MQPSEAIQSYLGVLRRLSGAQSISLFLPAGGRSAASRPLLLHDGTAPPAPELLSIEATGDLTSDEETGRDAGVESRPRVVPSRDPACRLLRLPPAELPARGNGAPIALARRRTDRAGQRHRPIWVGLRFAGEPPPLLDGIELPLAGATPAGRGEAEPAWLDLFAVGAELSAHLRQIRDILGDPVTGLPGRYELQGRLAAAVAAAGEESTPLSLLLVGADGFATVNERFGRQVGDQVIQTVAERLQCTLRASDTVAKFGGAIFACILDGADEDGTAVVAEKTVRVLSTEPYVDGTLALGFSIGAATYAPEQGELDHAGELVRRADLALNRAKRAGGGRFAAWRRHLDGEPSLQPAELSGVFTGNLAKDYRNMALLSETTAAVAGSTSADELVRRALEAIATTLQADRVALFELSGDDQARLVKGFCRTNGETTIGAELALPEDVQQLAVSSRHADGVLHRFADNGPGPRRSTFVVPLIVGGGDCVGSLYLDGRQGTLRLDASDHAFLRTVGAQLGVALDRARLQQLERDRQRQEEERLRADIENLHEALRRSRLEYSSSEMEALLGTVRRVAATDATVLISGESGTGKEVLVRTLHRLSPRRSGPLVIVDCAAIPAATIETELFGRLGGSKPGGEPERIGRLAEADGGTVLLDEVGDLPQEVQTKLLRFVQERFVTPVGSSRQVPVDVRVVAATHRDLAAEVRRERFREDLYYRLNVVRLHIPPLRDRPDDIIHLAQHFLSTFALLYRKPVRRLSAEAEAVLLRHSWPGNVRELENQIQQAVILSDGEVLAVHELGLVEPDPQTGDGGASGRESPLPAADELWERLRDSLVRHVEVATCRGRPAAPLGKWLGDDLVLEADTVARGVAARAAAAIGIPETTFRRRRSKASADAQAGMAPRPTSWQDVQRVLAGLIRSPRANGEDLLRKSQSLLLDAVLDRVPGDVKTGARLLGVTPPTFRRRVATTRPGAPRRETS
jgi:diguanylate cyclase (GGDEF)-like protein